VLKIDPGEQDTLTEVIVTGTVTVTLALADFELSCVDVAVIVPVPAEEGVNTPTLLTLPMLDGLTDQLTALLKLPVPVTDGVQVDVWFVRMDAGEQATPTDVIVGTTLTATLKLPDFETSCVDVAVIVAIPVEVGVNTPEALTLPMFDGLTDQVTALLKFPVPTTVDLHVLVWFVRIDAGLHITETEVIAIGAVTVTVVLPDLVVSCAEIAVRVAVPEDTGVKTPAPLTLPMLEGLTDQFTALLKLPYPDTDGVQADV
jgi:hypothetical protein